MFIKLKKILKKLFVEKIFFYNGIVVNRKKLIYIILKCQNQTLPDMDKMF